MENYTFKQITKNSINDLIPIFNNAFGIKVSFNQLFEKLDTFYANISYLGFVGYYKESTPCSYYGVYPVFAYINGKKILVCQSGDTMTHSKHNGKGLFIKSAELTYNLCIQNKVSGVFGFPSKSSFSGFKNKLNWSFNERINKYEIKVNSIPLGYIFNKFKLLNFIYLKWVDVILLFFKKGKIFPGSIRKNNQEGLIRDQLLWRYKMKKNENKLLLINNISTILKFNGRIGVGDIDIKTDTDIKLILRKLKLLAYLTFNSKIVFFVSPNTLLDDKLSKLIPQQEGLPIGFRNFDNKISLRNLKFTYFDFDTF